MVTYLLWILVVVFGVYWLFYEYFKTWLFFRRYKVKYDIGIPPFGTHFNAVFGKEKWYKTLERIYYNNPNEKFVGLMDIGGKVQWLIRDPALVRQITISDFSYFTNRIEEINSATDPLTGHQLSNLTTNVWRPMRQIITPLWTGQKLKQIVVPSLNETKIDLIEFVKNELRVSKTNHLCINMMDLMTRSIVDTFCLTALSLKTNSLKNHFENFGFYDAVQSYLNHRSSIKYGIKKLTLKFPWIMKYLFGITFTSFETNDFFMKSCQNIADKRIENRITRSDYLQLLQALRSKDSIKGTDAKDRKKFQGHHMLSQIFEFLNFTVTENNILATFISHRLSENSDTQQRLYEECLRIKENLNNEPLNYEALHQMKFMDMIISEALRLCPITTEMKRRATKPYFFKNNNGEKVPIEPGDMIWCPSFVLQNDSQYYANPNVFDPERYNDDNKLLHTPGTYAPYGMGPRDCIGCQYSTDEMKITFYHLLLNFSIEKVNGKEIGNNFDIKLKIRN